MIERERIQEELDQIATAHDGVLHPHDVVEFAQNPETALHGRFTWDDTKAAHEHRIWEARQVIRLYVNVVHEESPPTRVFVSLEEDRANGGGYRYVLDVLTDDQRRAQLVSQALKEFRFLRQKYQTLKELAAIYEAIDRAEDLPILQEASELVTIEA